MPTSYHAVVDTGVEKGDTVAIWVRSRVRRYRDRLLNSNVLFQGLGPIGLYAAKWAQIKGASRVIGIDRVPFRLQFAQ